MSKTAADPSATRHFKVFADGVEVPPEDAAAAASGARRRGAKLRGGDPLRRRGGGPPLRQRRPAARSQRRAAGVDRRVRRRDAPQAGRGRAARGRSPQGRIPGAAVARAAQPAGADPDGRPAHAAARATSRRRYEREVIVRQAQHLVRLVDDLLDVSRVARGKVTLAKQRIELAHRGGARRSRRPRRCSSSGGTG